MLNRSLEGLRRLLAAFQTTGFGWQSLMQSHLKFSNDTMESWRESSSPEVFSMIRTGHRAVNPYPIDPFTYGIDVA